MCPTKKVPSLWVILQSHFPKVHEHALPDYCWSPSALLSSQTISSYLMLHSCVTKPPNIVLVNLNKDQGYFSIHSCQTSMLIVANFGCSFSSPRLDSRRESYCLYLTLRFSHQSLESVWVIVSSLSSETCLPWRMTLPEIWIKPRHTRGIASPNSNSRVERSEWN